MRLLLDTHIFLWCITDDRRLSDAARSKIRSGVEVFVSSASIWEASIKAGLGKLHADMDALVDAIHASGFTELPISARHAARVSRLPPIHRDPFDRLLIAQAMSEPLHLITADAVLREYTELAEVF